MNRRYVFPLVAATLLAAGLAFRFALVAAWHVPGGDGLQYYALSQELARANRFAFAPSPSPLSFTRMPGYPLLLAYVAVRQAPLGLAQHLIRATRLNVLLDLGTALLVFSLLRMRVGRWPALVGAALVCCCPMLFLLSCYGLTETFATFLTTAALYCALRASGPRQLWWATLAGVVTGVALLTRMDSLTFALAVALALVWPAAPGPDAASVDPPLRRLVALALFGVSAATVFAPWPIRNQVRFGAPYPAAYYWRTNSGKALPMGPIHWARTWSTGELGQSYIDLAWALESPLEPTRPGILLPVMYDDEPEKARVIALFERYNRELFSAEVNAEFEALARDRSRRAPLRTYLFNPLRRLYHLWSPIPEWELPMRVRWAGLPQRRPWFGRWDLALYLAALVGAGVLLARRDGRRLGVILLVPVLLRSALYSYVVALGATERYLVEILPLLLVMAVIGASACVAAMRRRPT